MSEQFTLRPAEFEWRTINVDWSNISGNIIKGGTPMSRDGRIANDANAYGLVMDDSLARGYVKNCRVIISGAVDLDKAEAHSGIKLSAEARAALGGIWSSNGGSGGGGGVSSWNDLTDKPFGEEGGMVEVLPETALTFNESLAAGFIFTDPITLEVGKTYDVKYNGTSYSCMANEMSADGKLAITLGNMSAIGGEDSGEPFAMFVYPADMAAQTGVYMQVMPLDEASSVTISITTEGTVIHKLDNRYLDLDWLPVYSPGPTGEIIPEMQVTFPNAFNTMLYDGINIQIDLVPGEKYVVYWDGVSYECVAKETASENGTPGVSLGNSTVTEGQSKGEPFLVIAYYQNSISTALQVSKETPGGTYTLRIVGAGGMPNKLLPEFLPGGVPYVEENALLKERHATGITHPTFGQMWAVYGGVPNLKVGETYTITYNGTEYECVCQTAPAGLIQDPNAVAMGNFSPVGGEDTGEPFAMLVSYEYQEVDIIDLVGSAAVKVGITGVEAHKIDERCLPDSIGGVVYVNMTGAADGVVVDKTLDEIIALVDSGAQVAIKYVDEGGVTILPFTTYLSGYWAMFDCVTSLSTGGLMLYHVCVDADGATIEMSSTSVSPIE